MAELEEFLSWGAKVTASKERDSFGRTFNGFPYGLLSYWIAEFREHKSKEARRG